MDPELHAALHRWGGIARRAELIRSGATDAAIDAAWASGALVRVRHGSYALPTADPVVVRAHRVGGVLAGPAANPHLGLWTPPDVALTVSVFPTAHRLRNPDRAEVPLSDSDGVVVLRDRNRSDARRERLIVSVETAVVQALKCLEPRFALAVLDSALRLPAFGRPSLRTLECRLPARLLALARMADPDAEAGTESVCRWGLVSARLRFESQVELTPKIRVDFVVEGVLAVECVSVEFHSSPQKYNADRARISDIVRLGYTVLEFTYPQIMFGWEEVLATITAAVNAHRRPRR